MYRPTRIYLLQAPEMRAIECWMIKEPLGMQDKRTIAVPAVFREITKEEEGTRLDPSFYLKYDDAQHLMDELWKIGIRPSDIGTAGHLEAVKYHLEDMRKLVFDKKRLAQIYASEE